MQARFYAPWFGRFLSPDPARDQHFEETQSWNIYSYVRNQPTMMIDPTGMYSWDQFKKDVKSFFNYERHSSSSVTKAADGGTLTRDKVDVERKVSLSGGQAKASFSYESHAQHNEKKIEKQVGPVFFEAGATQTKGSVEGKIGAEAGLKGVKAEVGASVGPSLSGTAAAGFKVGDYKVTLLGGEIGGQVRLGAEAKVVSRDQGGFTLATAKIFAGLKVGLTIVDVKREKQ